MLEEEPPHRFMCTEPGKGGVCFCSSDWGTCDHTRHMPDYVNPPASCSCGLAGPTAYTAGDGSGPASSNVEFPHPDDSSKGHGASELTGPNASLAPSSVGATYGGASAGSSAGSSAGGDFNTTAATYGGSDTASVAGSGVGSVSAASTAGVDTTAATYGGSDFSDTASVAGSVDTVGTLPSNVGSEL